MLGKFSTIHPLVVLTTSLLLLAGKSVSANEPIEKTQSNEKPQISKKQSQVADDIEVIEVKSSGFASLNQYIIDRTDFVDSAQTVAEVINGISGIQVLSTGGVGSPVSVSIRGSNSKQVQLFIDGQLMNDGQFGSFDLNQIPTEQIERIEISKNQAAGTGSTPIGGVIKITTYNASEDHSTVSAKLGSFGYQELNLVYNQINNHNHFSLGGNFLSSDNDYRYKLESPRDNPNSDSTYEKMNNNHFSKKVLFINNNTEWANHSLRVNFQYNQQKKAILSYQRNDPKNRSFFSSDILRAGAQYTWDAEKLFIEKLLLSYNVERKNEHYADKREGITRLTADYDTNKTNLSLESQLVIPFKNYSFYIAPYSNYSEQKFSSDSLLSGQETTCTYSACDYKARQQQFHIGSRIEVLFDQLPISTYALVNILNESNKSLAIKQPDENELNKNEQYLTTELGAQFINKNFKGQLNFNKGVRTPTLFELFGNRGLIKANEDLKPEKATTLSINSQYSFKNFSINASIYQQKLKDSIVALYYGEVGHYDNISAATLNGFEIQANWDINKKSTLTLQSTLIDSSTSSVVKAYNNKKVPGIYHQQYSFSYQYTFTPAFKLNVQSSADLDLYFNRANSVEGQSATNDGNSADRFITDINLFWQHEKYASSLSVLNLFDHRYDDLTNRPAAGTTLFLKFSIRG